MQKILVSIIVPVYKAEEYIHKCIKSLQNQTYKDIEILLVNDGSPDNCPAICEQYAKEDVRIKVLHKTNGGLVSAWTAGVKASSGDYLCFVDSDDWVEYNMVEELIGFSASCTREVICSDIVLESGAGVIKKRNVNQLPAGSYEGEKLNKEIKNKILGNENRLIPVSRCAKLFSRELIENNLKYCDKRIKLGEDLNITFPVLLDAERIVILHQTFYHYVQHEASMVHEYDDGMYQNNLMLYDAIKRVVQEKEVQNGIDQINREYIYLLFLVMKNELRGNDRCVKTIKDICYDKRNRVLFRETSVMVKDTANHILYFMMKHPNTIFIRITKMIFRIHDSSI